MQAPDPAVAIDPRFVCRRGGHDPAPPPTGSLMQFVTSYVVPCRRVPVKLSWWHAGGLHAHVTYPDGSMLHRIWPKDSYWEIDALRRDLEHEYGAINVEVRDGR